MPDARHRRRRDRARSARPGEPGALTPTPIAVRAAALGIADPARPERVRTPEAVAAIAALRPDLGVLADYGQIVPASRSSTCRRTASSTSIRRCCRAIVARRRSRRRSRPATRRPGVSIIRMDDGIDTGPIVAQDAWPARRDRDGPGARGDRRPPRRGPAGRTISALAARASSRPSPQDERRRDADAAVPPRGRPPRSRRGPRVELERQVRAYRRGPGSFLETRDGRLGRRCAASVAPAGEAGARAPSTADRARRPRTASLRLRRGPAGRRPADAVAGYLRGRPGRRRQRGDRSLTGLR